MDLVLSAIMMLVCSLLTVFSVFASLVLGCTEGNGHDHGHSNLKRSVPPLPLTPPSRPLEWGDINILHTTDTHGWLLGHQKSSFPEPNYSGDLGDFASFVAHMKQIALEKDVDLLLVDSGDLHDGTGLSDGYPPGSVDAHESNQFLRQIPYDVMAIGNHELYIYENTLDMHQNFAPALNGRYLSSNVNITYADASNITRDVPVGSRFAKFKTRKGRRVTAFGVLFDFAGNDDNTTVQKVADMVKETWFLNAIREEPDLFLLAGHMPVVRDKWPLVFDAIRAIHPNTPITILGGHSHIRDCVQLDQRSMSLESGRYMETIGWMSLKFNGHPRSHENLTFSRRYLDANRVTYEYHTGRGPSAFDTEQGITITQGLHDLAARFDLNFTYGIAPRDYTLSQSPYPSNGSLLTLVIEEAAPYALSIGNPRLSTPNITIISSGNQRFNIFTGPFTKNDQFTASPFKNSFGYIQDVPLGTVLKALRALNGGENAAKRSAEREEAMYRMGDVRTRYLNWLEDMDRRYGVERREAMDNLTLGYVTSDSCPGVGDDIVHTPLPFFPTPDFVASRTPDVSNDTAVDFVFLDFNTDDAVEALNGVQTNKVYSEEVDVQLYSENVRTNNLLGIYAQAFWN